MVGALLRWLVFSGIFCGFYDGAGRTVVAPTTEACKVEGAGNLQAAELEVVVTSQIGESCHHAASSSRVQGSFAYPSGNAEFSNCSNGSYNMDMQILQHPNETCGVSLRELCKTLEAGTGGSSSKIKKSEIQKESQRKSIREKPKFDQWEGGVRDDRGRGNRPIWGASPVGDIVSTGQTSLDSNQFGGRVEGRRSNANSPRAEVTCSPRIRSRLGAHSLEGTQEGDEGASGVSRVPTSRTRTTGQGQGVVARAPESIDKTAKAAYWSGQSHQRDGCELESVLRTGSSTICRSPGDVSDIQGRTSARIHEEEPGSAGGQDGSPTGLFDTARKTGCRNPDRGGGRCDGSDHRSSARGCIHDARCGHGRGGGHERTGEERCVGSISDHSQTNFTYEGAFRSSQAKRVEEVNEPWNWSCDIWRRFSCGVSDDANCKSIPYDDDNDRKVVWNGEIPCPSDLWCINPGRQLNGLQTTMSLRSYPGRVKGTKRVSFDDRVIVIPIEARTEATAGVCGSLGRSQ